MFVRNPLNQSIIRQFTPECVYRNQQLVLVVEKLSTEFHEYRVITKANFITINTCYECCLHVHIIKIHESSESYVMCDLHEACGLLLNRRQKNKMLLHVTLS